MQSAAANHMIYNHFFSHSKRKYQQAIIQNQQESIILSLIDCHCKKQESIILSLIDCYCKKQEPIISCSKEKCLSINESQSNFFHPPTAARSQDHANNCVTLSRI